MGDLTFNKIVRLTLLTMSYLSCIGGLISVVTLFITK